MWYKIQSIERINFSYTVRSSDSEAVFFAEILGKFAWLSLKGLQLALGNGGRRQAAGGRFRLRYRLSTALGPWCRSQQNRLLVRLLNFVLGDLFLLLLLFLYVLRCKFWPQEEKLLFYRIGVGRTVACRLSQYLPPTNLISPWR